MQEHLNLNRRLFSVFMLESSSVGLWTAGIRQKSNATVKIEDNPFPDSTERPLTVTGPIERVHVALLDIVPILAGFNQQMKAKVLFAPWPRRLPSPRAERPSASAPPCTARVHA